MISKQASVEKQSLLRVLDDPRQPLLQVPPRHGTAPQHMPPMRSYRLQLQCLGSIIIVSHPHHRPAIASAEQPTDRISCSSMQPSTSVLFANTSRLAPARRCLPVSNKPPPSNFCPPSYVPLLAAVPAARPGSLQFVTDPWRPQPISAHPSSQSSSSSTTGASSALPRPLRRVVSKPREP